MPQDGAAEVAELRRLLAEKVRTIEQKDSFIEQQRQMICLLQAQLGGRLTPPVALERIPTPPLPASAPSAPPAGALALADYKQGEALAWVVGLRQALPAVASSPLAPRAATHHPATAVAAEVELEPLGQECVQRREVAAKRRRVGPGQHLTCWTAQWVCGDETAHDRLASTFAAPPEGDHRAEARPFGELHNQYAVALAVAGLKNGAVSPAAAAAAARVLSRATDADFAEAIPGERERVQFAIRLVRAAEWYTASATSDALDVLFRTIQHAGGSCGWAEWCECAATGRRLTATSDAGWAARAEKARNAMRHRGMLPAPASCAATVDEAQGKAAKLLRFVRRAVEGSEG
eukprot:Hpha_TRINITY_DN17411_c0_g1::TRINITY_DN17411_c0_g1_i1::g.85788::m.85788